MSVFSSSWCLGRAAVCDCGTPWTFFLPFFSYTLSLTDILVDQYTPSVYPRLLTDTSGYNVAGRSSYTLLLTDMRVYTSSDRPLYPGLLTDIPSNSLADTGLRILCL